MTTPVTWSDPSGWSNPSEFWNLPRETRTALGFIEVETYPDGDHVLINVGLIARLDNQGMNGLRTMVYWGAGNATAINETLSEFIARILAFLDHSVAATLTLAGVPVVTVIVTMSYHHEIRSSHLGSLPVPVVTVQLNKTGLVFAQFTLPPLIMYASLPTTARVQATATLPTPSVFASMSATGEFHAAAYLSAPTMSVSFNKWLVFGVTFTMANVIRPSLLKVDVTEEDE